jgi:hypothetical protein
VLTFSVDRVEQRQLKQKTLYHRHHHLLLLLPLLVLDERKARTDSSSTIDFEPFNRYEPTKKGVNQVKQKVTLSRSNESFPGAPHSNQVALSPFRSSLPTNSPNCTEQAELLLLCNMIEIACTSKSAEHESRRRRMWCNTFSS